MYHGETAVPTWQLHMLDGKELTFHTSAKKQEVFDYNKGQMGHTTPSNPFPSQSDIYISNFTKYLT